MRRELVEFYGNHGLTRRVTVVPDGCYVHTGEMGKFFVNVADYERDRSHTLALYLPNVDDELGREIDARLAAGR